MESIQLVLTPEDSKPGTPKSYRPLCLLNNFSRMIEALIKQRLKMEIKDRGLLVKHQYSIRKGRSTLQSVQAIKDTADKQAKK